MANSKRDLFLKRRLRVRNKQRKVNVGKLRLSIHRSNKNISAQLIDDVAGTTLASASSLEKDLGVSIVSTSKGVMSDANARSNNVGGEVLCTVF